MGLLNKIKKSFELKQNVPSVTSLKHTEKKISELKKQFESIILYMSTSGVLLNIKLNLLKINI